MVKRLLYLLVSFLFYLLLSNRIFAAGEFTADYDVSYSIAPSGTAIVTQNVTLTNKLTNLYAKEYSIIFDSTSIRNVIAYDDLGQITPIISQTDGKTEIKLPFNAQVIGVGKSLPFSLRFESDGIATKLGSIWEIHIPGITQTPDLGSYMTTVSVPPTFGPVAYMSPPPADGTRWNREQMVHGGISIGYGTKQQYALNLSYYLHNSGVTPKEMEIALPPDTAYQTVTIGLLDPKPKEISRDSDGNWLARYAMGPGQKLDITASLYVALSLDPKSGWADTVDVSAYLMPQRYWESTDPEIISRAKSLKTPEEIYTYVVNTLSYDYSRVSQTPIRKGARAALASPTTAICMEFTDLFIALSRAAGIPAREVLGFAYTTNTKLRPLSLVTDVLHAWPEYYDRERGQWVPVDPTWGDTTGGIDYFHQLDFNHITFAIQGLHSEYPYPAGFYRRPDKTTKDVSVTFAEVIPLSSDPILSTTIEFPEQIYAGFESRGLVRVTNPNNTSIGGATISVQSTPFDVSLYETVSMMPPLSSVTLPLAMTITEYLANGQGRVIATVNDQTITHEFTIRPAYWLLIPGLLLIAIAGVILLLVMRKSHKPWIRK